MWHKVNLSCSKQAYSLNRTITVLALLYIAAAAAAGGAAPAAAVALKMSERRSEDLYVQILHNTMSVVY